MFCYLGTGITVQCLVPTRPATVCAAAFSCLPAPQAVPSWQAALALSDEGLEWNHHTLLFWQQQEATSV